MSFIDTLIGQLAPHDCLGCGQEGTLLCSVCRVALPAAPPGHKPEGLHSIKAATIYDGVAKDLLWQLKSQGSQAAARLMAKRMAPLMVSDSGQLVVPVPTATQRVRQRGYDQAKLIARHLARYSGSVYLDCLRRQGQAHQVGADRQQRLRQLQAAYRLKTIHDIHGYSVILVDDVMTTGATLEAAAAVLRAAGAARIDAIVFAQA